MQVSLPVSSAFTEGMRATARAYISDIAKTFFSPDGADNEWCKVTGRVRRIGQRSNGRPTSNKMSYLADRRRN
jgi:hypothetical protein